MKRAVFTIVFVFAAAVVSFAQQPIFFKEAFSTAVADTIIYPVHGNFKIDESGFGNYKTLQLWVYDAREKEVYYTVQSVPTREEYVDLVEKMIDKTYALFMMRHGHALTDKCEETDLFDF